MTYDQLDGLDAPLTEAGDTEGFEQIPEMEGFGEALFDEEYLDIFHRMPPRAASSDAGPSVGFPSGLSLALAAGATGEGEEHWDPHDTGLPLLATGPETHGQRLSRNFTVRELVVSGGQAASTARISPHLVQVLQAIRDRVGKPMSVFSGYRSWKRNNQVYDRSGKKTTLSRHCSGQAADFKVAGVSGIDLAKIAIDVGGTDLGIGVWADKLHVDVRPQWAIWTYMKGAADTDAKARVNRYRQQVLKGGVSPAPAPSPQPTPVPAGNRLVVDRHPLLHGHKGTAPDLILRWNAMAASGVTDVVVHFHGYSGRKGQMRLSDKEAASGLDFADPEGSGAPGRNRPAIAVLPRGSYVGDQPGRNPIAYDFPRLTCPGALRALIDDALARVGAATGQSLTLGRLVLTGHSGGGSPIDKLLAHQAENDPDEVHIFDGMYQPGSNLLAWARRRVERELASPAAIAPALRIIYNARSGTEKHSKAAASALCAITGVPGGARLRARVRVDRTEVEHNAIPRRFGWRLLGDAGADLPATTTSACVAHSVREAADGSNNNELAWNDLETLGQSDEELDPQSLDTGWTEEEPAFESDGEAEHDLTELEAEASAETEQMFDASWGEAEGEEPEYYSADLAFGGSDEFEMFEPGEAEESQAAAWDVLASETTMLDRLLESEAGAGTGLADRLKGVAAFALGPTLRRGDSGAGVAGLQRALGTLGADLAVDGAFGPNTERAVRTFQARSALSVDGIVGPATKAAISAALGGGAAPAPTPTPSSSDLAAAIVRVAEEEFHRWHPAGRDLRETDSAATPILQRYYREALGLAIGAADLQSTAWQKQHPWSAVFVSWVMRTAGAGSDFLYSAAHQAYIRAARRNRLTGLTGNPFWAYRATEIAPEVGDLVCASRADSGATYDNIADAQLRATHCDIVTEVRPGSLRVVGGNFRQDVGAKTIRTLPDGRLALDGDQQRFFAVLRCRGQAVGAVEPAPPAPPVPASTGKKLTPAQFVAAFAPSAQRTQATHGVPALVTLGQAALESGWGAKAPRFNFFGLKAKASDPADGRQLLRTREVLRSPNVAFPEVISVTPRPDGRYTYIVRDWFRAFPNAAAAFDHHGKTLRKPIYAKAFANGSDPYRFAAEVHRAGYATDPSYTSVLHRVMRMIEATGDLASLAEAYDRE